ncbi:MAG: DUF4493 domain-containing protein [Phocaeicola sp.]
MSKQIIYIISLIGVLLLAACSKENSPALSDETGEIRFSVIDTTEANNHTRAPLDFDVNEFKVNLTRGEYSVFSNKRYGDILETSYLCAASNDYLLTAESCTEEEAESVNDGWGQFRISGKQAFAVIANQSNTVTVNCGLSSSSVNVVFSDFVESTFENYSIELYATDATERTLTFDESNYKSKTAYFNVGETGRELSYTVTLPAFEIPYSGTLTLKPSRNYNLSVKVEDEGSNSTVTLGIIVDGTLLEEIILTEKISPYV